MQTCAEKNAEQLAASTQPKKTGEGHAMTAWNTNIRTWDNKDTWKTGKPPSRFLETLQGHIEELIHVTGDWSAVEHKWSRKKCGWVF